MYHALIVDNELPALRFVRSIIEQFASGFEVVGTATSGEQGLELLGQQKVDLILLQPAGCCSLPHFSRLL